MTSGDPFSFRSRVLRAGGWSLSFHFISTGLRLVSSLITTRIFTPDVFGIMGMAMVLQVLIGILSDIGVHQSVVQSPQGDDRSFLNTAWTLQILRGFYIWGVCLCVAGGLYLARIWGYLPNHSVYATPILPPVLASISFAAVILGFQSIKAITFNRNLDLRRITLIEFFSQVVGLVVIVGLGLVTRSIWAFVLAAFCSASTGTALSHLWLTGARDRLAWDRKALRDLARFGRWVFASSAVGATVSYGDRLLLGGWVGPTVIGFYSIASNIAQLPAAMADRLYGTVLFPALSEVARQSPDRLSTIYSRFRWGIDASFVGMAGFLFATGELIVRVLYDSRYADAGPMLKWLSFGLLFSRYSFAQSAYLALGRPNYVVAINVVRAASLFVLVPSLFYALGVFGAVLGIALQQGPTVPLIYYLNHRHRLNNIKLEIGVLAMWPLGWLVGACLVVLLRLVLQAGLN